MAEYKDPTPISPKDIDYDTSKVDPRVKNYADQVRNKKNGLDVREAQARNAEIASLVSTEANERSKDLGTQFQHVIDETTGKDIVSAPEIIAARSGEANLKARLDKENQEVTAQLAHTESKLNKTVSFSGNVDDLLKSIPQPSMHSYFSSDDAMDTSNQTYDEFVDLFHSIYDENQSYITKRVMGKASDGVKDVLAYYYEPENYTKTLIISAGMHGWEKMGVITLYNFLKLVTESWAVYPQFAYIRHNVRLVVVPIVNPWGLQVNSRQNSNGVDINRNFNYKWNESSGEKGSSPESEVETQYLATIIREESNAVGYIDMHNMNSGDRTFKEVLYTPINNPAAKTVEFEKMIQTARVSDSAPLDDIINGADWSTGFNYANTFGMYSYCPEFVPSSGIAKYGEDDMTRSFYWYVNLILLTAAKSHMYKSLANNKPRAYLDTAYYTSGGTAVPVSVGSYGLVPNTRRSIANNVTGYAKIKFIITVSATFSSAEFADRFLFLTPVIYQKNSKTEFVEPNISGTNIPIYNTAFQQYKELRARDSLTVEALIPINKFEGDLTYELQAYTTAQSVSVNRVNCTVELIPSESSVDIRRRTNP